MSYFFGQSGGLPTGQHASSSAAPTQTGGRAFAEAGGNAVDGVHGLRTSLDGSNPAYDMKSLEKHIEAIPSEAGSLALSPREEMETTLIRSLIASYFSIVRQMIQDLVPKAIMHLLVNHTSQHVQDRLVSALYKPELFPELLHEDETIVNERARVKALLDAYKEAFKTLSEVSLKPA